MVQRAIVVLLPIIAVGNRELVSRGRLPTDNYLRGRPQFPLGEVLSWFINLVVKLERFRHFVLAPGCVDYLRDFDVPASGPDEALCVPLLSQKAILA